MNVPTRVPPLAPPEVAAADAPPRDQRPLWRRMLPFVIAAALIAAIVAKLDLRAFYANLLKVNYPAFLGFVFVFNLLLLSADSVATSFVYRRTICPVKTREFFLIRGASYLPSLLNHHVGQAWLTWYVSRAYKAPLWRVAGATLLVYATTFGSLFLFGAISLLFEHNQAPWIGPVLVVAAVSGVGYLAVIRIRPKFLADRQLLAPLFEVGVSGHLQALSLRILHVFVLFLGSWLPFFFFDVNIPAGTAFAYLPVLMVIVALPITPQGAGTRDVVSVTFFSQFAAGNEGQQRAAVLATTVTFAVALSLIQVIFSSALMRRALRMIAAAQPPQLAADGSAERAPAP
jgi:hypothetical protein